MNWWNFSSRTFAHENALKRSLFVNYSSNDFDGVTEVFGAVAGLAGESPAPFPLAQLIICNQQVVGSNPTAGSIVNRESASNDDVCLDTSWTLFRFQSLENQWPSPRFWWPAFFIGALGAFVFRARESNWTSPLATATRPSRE